MGEQATCLLSIFSRLKSLEGGSAKFPDVHLQDRDDSLEHVVARLNDLEARSSNLLEEQQSCLASVASKVEALEVSKGEGCPDASTLEAYAEQERCARVVFRDLVPGLSGLADTHDQLLRSVSLLGDRLAAAEAELK